MTRACPPPKRTTDGEDPAGDRIELRGLRAAGVHGVLPEEKLRPQPFEIDIDLAVDLGPAARSDRLSDTVDYAAVSESAAAVVTDRSFDLLEALADAVAAAVLATDSRITAATVGLRKLEPPLAADIATVGVRITRGR